MATMCVLPYEQLVGPVPEFRYGPFPLSRKSEYSLSRTSRKVSLTTRSQTNDREEGTRQGGSRG